MAILLAMVAYAVLAVFYLGIVWRFFMYSRGGPTPVSGKRPSTILLALLDIFLLRRVYVVNPGIWPGAWVFHISFIMVFLGHLRFFFLAVPVWVLAIARILPFSGVALVASLLYIFIYRLAVERGKYTSVYNLVLTAVLFFLGFTGVLLVELFRTDVTKAKQFMLGIFSFAIIDPPQSWLFALHFILAFIVLAFLPTHIFTAPFVTIEARKRQKEIEGLLHD